MMTQKRGVGVMTDKERREDDALKNLIQAAYDFSDDELLADLEEVEATLSDSDFPGIEDRMYRKMMAKLAEEEAAAQTLEKAEMNSADKNEKEFTNAEVPKRSEIITEAPPVAVTAETVGRVVRFGKKKMVVVGILAAAFVGMLGVTAIGGKSYFFRDREKEIGVAINNDKNLDLSGDLQDAYNKIEEVLGVNSLKFTYIPKGMTFFGISITNGKAVILLDYEESRVRFIQELKSQSASVGVNSDRKELDESIQNVWIQKEVFLEEEVLEDGDNGYSISFSIDNVRYRLVGRLPKDEFVKIVENLNF